MSSHLHRITIDPNFCHGKPVIRGMRYTVEHMLELMASGMAVQELLENYPDLEHEDLLDCLCFASKLIQVKSVHKMAS